MKKVGALLTAAVAATLCTVGLSTALGLPVTPLAALSQRARVGEVVVEGSASLIGDDFALPFELTGELFDDGEFEVREVKVGEEGIDITFPAITRRIEEAVGPVVEAAAGAGQLGRLRVGPVRLGFYVDRLRVDATIRLTAPVPNPYANKCPTSEDCL